MKFSCLPVLRAAMLASVCALAFPAASRAENPLTNISGKIKNGVSNVGSAIKKTAKAAKNIVTPGKAAEEKPAAPRPAAAAGGASKKAPATPAVTGSAAKTRRSTPDATKPAAVAAAKPKPKSTAPVAASSSGSKTKVKPKVQSTASSDSSNKPKARRKTTESIAAQQESETASTPSKKQRGADTNAAVPGTAAAESQPAGTMMEADNRNGETNASPEEAKPAEKLLFGTPAFGRKGFVYSPYAPDQGLIDVRNVAAGAKVRCPYTGNIFRVP